MKILTSNQKIVLRVFQDRPSFLLTPAEVAQETGLAPSSARTAVMALVRYGVLVPKGTSETGGQSYALRRA